MLDAIEPHIDELGFSGFTSGIAKGDQARMDVSTTHLESENLWENSLNDHLPWFPPPAERCHRRV
jgi:hypothetical protein